VSFKTDITETQSPIKNRTALCADSFSEQYGESASHGWKTRGHERAPVHHELNAQANYSETLKVKFNHFDFKNQHCAVSRRGEVHIPLARLVTTRSTLCIK